MVETSGVLKFVGGVLNVQSKSETRRLQCKKQERLVKGL